MGKEKCRKGEKLAVMISIMIKMRMHWSTGTAFPSVSRLKCLSREATALQLQSSFQSSTLSKLLVLPLLTDSSSDLDPLVLLLIQSVGTWLEEVKTPEIARTATTARDNTANFSTAVPLQLRATAPACVVAPYPSVGSKASTELSILRFYFGRNLFCLYHFSFLRT
jgi:hypothetical protein